MDERSFEERAADLQKKYLIYRTTYNRIAIVRIVLFIVFLVVAVLFANAGIGYGLGASVLIFPVLFGALINYHNRVKFERDQFKFLVEINNAEVSRLKGHLSGFDGGEEHVDLTHPYTGDLDIFGPNSLFKLLNRSSTPSGKLILAEWLKTSANHQTILKRQAAVKELVPLMEWRQEFQALGLHDKDQKRDIDKLEKWIAAPSVLKGDKWYAAASYLMPLAVILFITLNITIGLSIYYVLAFLVLNGLLLKKVLPHIQQITDDTSSNVGLLKSYSRLIKKIEEARFHDIYLKDLQSSFYHENFKASVSILKLQKVLDFLNSRANMFYVLFDLIFLIDIHLVRATERWKKKNEHDVSIWFDHIGTFEALNSLAGFGYANKGYVFPEILPGTYQVSVKNMGHPLIHSSERVTNDFEISGRGSIAVITGSNMSGKSTFQRTLGVNVVLALSGAPVCVKEMSLSRMQVFTSMRTQDNLEEHVSSFYAELKRIKQLLQLLKDQGIPVLFMLDEILKGTNSKDRHLGSASLIKQLSGTESFGLISTHDLELGQLENRLTSVKNYSFNSEVKDDEILFDYKLSKGVCHSFNASKLMQKMGINISADNALT